MPKCSLCEESFSHDDLSGGICRACEIKHAIPADTPPLRPLVPCTRCQGRSFVRCKSIRERAHWDIAPLAATYAHEIHETAFLARQIRSADTKQPVGVFEAYICRQCGYTELYTRDANTIPIGPEYATELFEVGGGGDPYRNLG